VPVIVLAALAIGVVGYVSYTTWQANQDSKHNNQDSPLSNTQSGDVSVDWETYENKDLGFSFVYPESWGPVSINEVSNPKTGRAYTLQFGVNDKIIASVKTPDFVRIRSVGSGYSFFGPGFTNYDAALSQVKDGGSVATEEPGKYAVVANFDCVDVGYFIKGLVKFNNSDFAGIGFGYFKDLQGTGACTTDDKPLSNFLEQGVQDQLIEVVKSVKSS
jgi:hypothetical protein